MSLVDYSLPERRTSLATKIATQADTPFGAVYTPCPILGQGNRHYLTEVRQHLPVHALPKHQSSHELVVRRFEA